LFRAEIFGLCFNVGYHILYYETDSVSFNDATVYVRTLDFQANICEAFAEDKNAALLWRLSFAVGSFAKDRLQLLVNRISIKTLEKLPALFT